MNSSNEAIALWLQSEISRHVAINVRLHNGVSIALESSNSNKQSRAPGQRGFTRGSKVGVAVTRATYHSRLHPVQGLYKYPHRLCEERPVFRPLKLAL